MVWLSSIARRGAPVAGAATSASVRAARSSSATLAAARLRQLNHLGDHNGPALTCSQRSQRRRLSDQTAPSTGAAAAAPAAATSASGASPQAGSAGENKAKSGAAGGDVNEELWIVGRFMENMDTRLGAKQERIRVRETGVIERYKAIISTLDGSLEPREGDDFLSWLRSQGFDADNNARACADPAADGSPDGNGGVERNSDGTGETADGAKRRAEVETFLSAAAARLNALVTDKEELLFGDRGGDDDADEKEQTVSPNMSDEDLYQARLGAHRAMLCHCLSLLSSNLSKQQLKSGLSVEEVAAVARTAYLASTEARLEAVFPLFDTHGDGHLDSESVERAVDAVVLPVVAAAERCYLAAARPALDKKVAAVMPATMKYALWDVLEIPVKRRCCFAWAEDRKQVGPDEWRVSWEQFAPSRRKYFPELEFVAENYLAEFSRRRSAWHTSRKRRKKAMVYGSALLIFVLFVDDVLKMV
eukprot:g18353.t1